MKLYAIHIFIFREHRLLRIKLLWSSNLVSCSIYKGHKDSEELSYNQFLNLAPLMPRVTKSYRTYCTLRAMHSVTNLRHIKVHLNQSEFSWGITTINVWRGRVWSCGVLWTEQKESRESEGMVVIKKHNSKSWTFFWFPKFAFTSNQNAVWFFWFSSVNVTHC